MAHEDSIRPNASYSAHPQSLEDREAMMEVILPFHGSCSKCHHLHTNRPFRYFLNIKKNLRFKCEHCNRDMFGLGNNSTQTTLASQETLSPRSSWPTSSGSASIPRVSITDPEHMRLARPSQDLGTIAEDTSPDRRSVDGAHRSASSLMAGRVTEPGDGDASRAQSVTVISPSIDDGSIANIRSSEETLDCHDQQQLGIPQRRLRKWKDRITRWIGRWRGTKIEVTFPIHQGYPKLKISREPTRENPHNSVHRETQSQPTQAEQTTTMLSISRSYLLPATPSTPLADQTHSHDEEHAAEPSSGAVETAEDETSAQAAKRERIKALRREKTERNKAAENTICQCPEECQCRLPMRSSSIDSHSHRHSVSTSDVPSHSLGHIWGSAQGETNLDSVHGRRRSSSPIRQVAFVGAGAWMNPSAAHIHHYRSRHSDSWDSQATTAVSNGSDISLEGFRPAARRSHSLPPVRQFLHRHGPVIRNALRDDTVHSQFQSLARQARNSDSPPATQDSTRVNSAIPLATETDSTQGNIDNTAPPHPSSTSLANLAAPDTTGQPSHSSSMGSSVHRSTPSPEMTHAPEPTSDGMEGSPIPVNNDLPEGASSASLETGSDTVATELNHVSDGASAPSRIGLSSPHRRNSSLTNHVSQPTSGEEHDSTSVS